MRAVRMRKCLRLIPGIVLGLALALARFTVALAHAVLLSAAPNPNSLFPTDDPPQRVEITFSEEVSPAFSVIRVLNQSGERVDEGDTQAVNPGNTALSVSLKPLEPGIYTVAWEVLSAVDGHPSSGSYSFGVGVTPAAQVTSTAPGSTPASLGARWLALTGQVLLLGVFAFRFLVWRPALREASSWDDPDAYEDTRLELAMARHAVRVGWIGLGLVGLGLLLAFVAQKDAIGGMTITNAQAWLGTRFGRMWVIRLWLTLGLIFDFTDLGLGLKEEGQKGLRGWGWWAGLALSAAVGLTLTLVSHSAALQQRWQMALVSDGAHLLAAGVWVGGLVQLAVATRLTRALPHVARIKRNLSLALNFSNVAALAVGLLLVSGGYLAWQHVGTWAALFRTTYGLILLAKIGLALPAFAIAAMNLLVIKPRLAAAAGTPNCDHTLLQRRFHRLVLIEAALALSAAAAAGFLTDFQRGRDALLVAEQSQVVVSQSADDLHVTLTIEPALWGQVSTFDVYLLDADGRPVSNAREVSLRLRFLDRALGTNKVTAEPVGNGHYRAQGSYFGLGGTWEAEIAVRRPDAFDSFAAFQLETATDGVIRPLSSSSTLAARLTGWLTQGGGRLTGGALILLALAWVIPAVQAARGKISLALLLLPSLMAMWAGVSQVVEALSGPPVAPSGDPGALAWLAESDAAMNRLTSVELLRTTRGDDVSGPVVTETITFQAPNLFYDRVSNGSENLAQGAMYYYRRPGDVLWQAIRQNEPFTFPHFDQTRQAVSAKQGKIEDVDRRQALVVTYTVYILRNPVVFTRWIDVETKLILQEYMDAPGHHMLSAYYDFNEPFIITVPEPSEIGPTPTVIVP